jgi:neurofibromin 1
LFQLPVHSGVNICQVEADEALQQAIETLVDLSHDSADFIAWAIAELLDKFAKVCSGRARYRGLVCADSY